MFWLTVILTVALFGYRLLAIRLRFGAPITDRSSHTKFIPTGGGIILIPAVIAFTLANDHAFTTQTVLVMASALALCISSLIDDIRPQPPVPRLILQIVTVAISFSQLYTAQLIDIYLLVIFCGVGCINVFNFIDGIAGMLVSLCIVILVSFLYTIEFYQITDVALLQSLIYYLLPAVIALAVFNIPDRLFAGDVGAITLGFLITYILFSLIFKTANAALSILVIVPVFDTGFTTLQRLFVGENILLPHRKCIYQVLTSAWHLPHLTVSAIYSLLQLLINALFFLIPASQHWTYYIIVLTLLIITYFAIRRSPRTKQVTK